MARHDTGPDKATRELVAERDGWRCVRCGSSIDPWPGYSLQHRAGRGMGGSSLKAINSPANLVLVCGSATTGCHGEVEANPRTATREGYRVPRGTDPAFVKLLRHDGEWVYLKHDGSVELLSERRRAADEAAAGVPHVESAQFRRTRIPDAADKNPPFHEAVRARKAAEKDGAA